MNFKNILIVAILATGITVFTSCEKDNDENLEQATTKKIMTYNRSNNSGLVNRHFFDDKPGQKGIEGVDYGCKPPAGSCQDNIYVSATQTQNILEEIIDNHNGGIDVVDNDIIIFSKYRKALVNVVFTEEDVDNLIMGLYTLRIRSEDKIISKNENNYYIFKANLDIKSVYPIQINKY